MADKCEWCGSPIDTRYAEPEYTCGTTVESPHLQTGDCKDRQIAQLKARNAKLEQAIAIAVERFCSMRDILDALDLEARNEN